MIIADAPKDAIARIKLQIATAESEEEKEELYVMLAKEKARRQKNSKKKLWGKTEAWA
jgi:hypothetical protein